MAKTENKPNTSDYAEALRELESGNINTGIWAKAFAESEGDDAKTKARYISLRADEIRRENNLTSLPSKQSLGTWRRFFARNVDILFYQLVVLAAVFLIPNSVTETFNLREIFTGYWLLSIATFCTVEPTLILFFGNTLGKSILGISLVPDSQEKMSFENLFYRTFLVLAKGCGFLIPLIHQIANLVSKINLENRHKTSWDHDSGFTTVIKPISNTNYFLYVFVLLLLAAAHSFIQGLF